MQAQPHSQGLTCTAWSSTELRVPASMDSGYESSHDKTTVNRPCESGRCCLSTRAQIVSVAQGHRYLCAELDRWRRWKGARLGGVAATWRATCFALRQREVAGPAAGSALHAHTSALCLKGSRRMWLGHVLDTWKAGALLLILSRYLVKF